MDIAKTCIFTISVDEIEFAVRLVINRHLLEMGVTGLTTDIKFDISHEDGKCVLDGAVATITTERIKV